MQKLYNISPVFLQNVFISFFNTKVYTYRYTGRYKEFFNKLSLPSNRTDSERLNDLSSFLKFAKKNSSFYGNRISFDFKKFEDIRRIPILTKEDLRENINSIITIPKEKGVIAKTGGTTGASLKVYYTKADNQRRFANVNAFRAHFGYRLGQKTAWFSGKSLLSKDSRKSVFWRTDHLFKIRYYSTFHISEKTALYYLQDILKYKPLYIVGFPSCFYELAVYGLDNKIEKPDFVIAIFPNAETITDQMREVIEQYFGSKIYDQYGSAEGAPHIFQYKDEYELDPREGFLEVLDENDQPAQIGRMIVTSYHTKGTPLVRYDIGDVIELEEKYEYSRQPKIKKIIGRKMNFILSPVTGKINAVNVSNATKNVNGINAFQIIQESLDEINVKIKKSEEYKNKDEKLFINNIRERIGYSMQINIEYVAEISRDKSGKFNIIKNKLLK
jgi:phenylacetate-CoA ligase